MELIFDVFLVCVFAVFFFLSGSISEVTIANDNLGSSGFPRLIALVAIVLLVFSIAFRVQLLIRKRSSEQQSDEAKIGIAKNLYIRLFAMVFLLSFYIVFLKQLGFVLETLLFIYLCLVIMGERNHLRSAVFSVAFTALLVIIFGRVFFIALPRGIGILREVSYYLF